MKLRTRIHEWLADRLPWVQYPRIQPANARTRQASDVWAHSMYWPHRLGLALGGLALVVAGTALVVIAAFVAWSLFTS